MKSKLNQDSTHSLPGFYKYYSRDISLDVLKTGEVWWNCPLEFNDPHDMQRPLSFGRPLHELVDEMIRQTAGFVVDGQEPSAPITGSLRPTVDMLRNLAKLGQAAGVSKFDQIALMEEKLREGLKDWIAKLVGNVEKVQQVWFDYGRKMRVFCVGERPDTLPMWAHYSENHKGAVFSLRAIHARQSKFSFMRRVNYVDEPPLVASFDQLINHFFSGQRVPFEEFFPNHAYTKSKDWEYEREWRCHINGDCDDKSKPLKVKLERDELDKIFIGCRADESFVKEVTALAKDKFPDTTIVRMRVSNSRFAVEPVE